MRRNLLVFLFVFLLFLVAVMGYLVFSSPKLLLSDQARKILTETVGVDFWKNGKSENVEENKNVVFDEFGIRQGQLDKPLTVFVPESQQQTNGHILSRGFDLDGFERVMIRGQFAGMQDVSLLTKGLGRSAFEIASAGKKFKVYLGKTVKAKCQSTMFYDKNGVGHDLTRVMVEYDQHVDEAILHNTAKIVPLFKQGDEMAVIARYSDEVLEGLMLVGFDCELPN